MSSFTASVTIRTAPHDLDDRLVRVLVIASHSIEGRNDFEYTKRNITEMPNVEHALYIGRQTMELYVLDANLRPALNSLFILLMAQWEISKSELELPSVKGRDFTFDRFEEWFEAFDIARKGGSPFRPL